MEVDREYNSAYDPSKIPTPYPAIEPLGEQVEGGIWHGVDICVHPDLKFCFDEHVASIVSSSYVHIDENVFRRGANGLVPTQEYMVCECKYDRNVEKHSQACGKDSNCINRELFIECIGSTCPCGENCQNQRFAKRQYCSIEVFQTEKKGLGVRAIRPIPAGTFVIEYCGEALSKTHFKKRFRKHLKDNNRHLYFMSLKSGEYLDASRKGNISRFMNHSCSPNSVLNKWIVGGQWRIGIFAKRDINSLEELNFDYKIGRYRSKPQRCYCETKACKGFIGAFDPDENFEFSISTSDNEFSVSESGDESELESDCARKSTSIKGRSRASTVVPGKHGNLSTKGAVIELKSEEDIMNLCRSLINSVDDPHVIESYLRKILEVSSKELKRRFVWCHGLRILSNCIAQHMSTNLGVCHLALKVISMLQISCRNSALILKPEIEALSTCPNAEIAALSSKLLDSWQNLKFVYKIPKKVVPDQDTNIRTTGGSNIQQSPDSELKYPECTDELEYVSFAKIRQNNCDSTENDHKGGSYDYSERARSSFRRSYALNSPKYSKHSDYTYHSNRNPEPDAYHPMEETKQEIIPSPLEGVSYSDIKLIIEKAEQLKKQSIASTNSCITASTTVSRKDAYRSKALKIGIAKYVIKRLSKIKHRFSPEGFKITARSITMALLDKELRARQYSSSAILSEHLPEKTKVNIKKYLLDYFARRGIDSTPVNGVAIMD